MEDENGRRWSVNRSPLGFLASANNWKPHISCESACSTQNHTMTIAHTRDYHRPRRLMRRCPLYLVASIRLTLCVLYIYGDGARYRSIKSSWRIFAILCALLFLALSPTKSTLPVIRETFPNRIPIIVRAQTQIYKFPSLSTNMLTAWGWSCGKDHVSAYDIKFAKSCDVWIEFVCMLRVIVFRFGWYGLSRENKEHDRLFAIATVSIGDSRCCAALCALCRVQYTGWVNHG